MEDPVVDLRRAKTPLDLSFRSFMTFKEIQVLWKCIDVIESQIDPVFVAHFLVNNGYITKELYDTITHMVICRQDRSSIMMFLLRELTGRMSLQTLIKVLNELSYKDVAAKLLLALFKHQHEAVRVSGVYKSTSGKRPMIHTFFRNLKRMVHDAQFNNPREALQKLADKFMMKMNLEIDPAKKQIFADKCIAILGAEIDAIAITFDTGLRNSKVFDEMRSLTTNSSNTMITDVVYYGRLANAQCIAGQFEDGENMLRAARSQAYHIGPCLELVNMLYIEVCVRLWKFEYTPTIELRKSLMLWGHAGLKSLEEEDVDTKKLWRRMFILRMVFCLIGLGKRANVIPNCPICASDIAEAKLLLADIEPALDVMEIRRKMFFYASKARIAELTNHKEDCITYWHEAACMARHGQFEELKFIMVNLNRMTNSKMYTTELTPLTFDIRHANETDRFNVEALDDSQSNVDVSRESPRGAEAATPQIFTSQTQPLHNTDAMCQTFQRHHQSEMTGAMALLRHECSDLVSSEQPQCFLQKHASMIQTKLNAVKHGDINNAKPVVFNSLETTWEQYVILTPSSFEHDFHDIRSTDNEERVSFEQTFLKQRYQENCTPTLPHTEENDTLHEETQASRQLDTKEPFGSDKSVLQSDGKWQQFSGTISEPTKDLENVFVD